MWWSDLLRLTAVVLVAGCGFAPAYGPGSPAAGLRDSIRVEVGERVLDYRLRAALEERLGRGAAYVLSVTAQVDARQAAVTPEGTIMRYNLTGTAAWVLQDAAGTRIAEGEARGFTGYLTTGSTVATDAAARDASDRLAVILADRIVAQLAMTAGAG
jgi:LPS-assembly lipoprotein